MKKTNLILTTSVVLLLSGCGGGSSSTPAPEVISGLSMPSSVEIIQDNSATPANLASVNHAAYNTSGTDYDNAVKEVWINGGEWQEPFITADGIACIISATGASNHPNDKYLALVQDTLCFEDENASPGNVVERWSSAIVDSSRADDNPGTPQYNKIYFELKYSGGVDDIATDVIVSAEPSTANPWGEWSMHYDMKNQPTGMFDTGAVSIKKSDNDINFKFISKGDFDSDRSKDWDWDKNWVNGILKADKSGGKAKIWQELGWVDSGAPHTYSVDFNTTHAAYIKDDGAVTCQSLTSFDERAYRYNIYNEDGSEVDTNSQIELVFGVNKDKRAWVGRYKSGGTASSPTYSNWMWTEDGSKPETVYLSSDNSVSKSVTWTNGIPVVNNINLTPPILFDQANNSAISSNLDYAGEGKLWGLGWTKVNGRWQPDTSLADGTQLTDTLGTNYRIKSTAIGKTPNIVTASNCTNAGLDPSAINYTKPVITNTATDIAWSDKPVVSSEVKVKHGITQ